MTDYTELKRLAEACGDLNWRAIQENWSEWAICSGALNATREDVSKALQRLKRKGVMKNKGPFWEWKAPSRQEVGYD